MQKIQAIIFDMDGLMIDSEGKQSESVEQVLREHGVEPEFNEAGVIQIVGIPATDNFQILKDKHRMSQSVDELHERKKEIYRELLEEGVTPMPGLFELFEYLQDKPLKKAVASSSIIKDIELVIQHLDAIEHFDAIVSAEEVERGKPAPDVFLEAAKRLGVDPEHCVVLEDAPEGVKAGKAAGMKVIAIPNRYTKHHDFDHADTVVDSLHDIKMSLLESL